MPPRRITALPDFRQREAASAVTFGRASKIIPITPKGTLTLVTVSPLGSLLPLITFPTGSGREATFLTPSAILLILSSPKVRRSIRLSVSPFFLPFSTSMLLAFIITSEFSSRASAIAISASSFLLPATDSTLDASLAFLPISSITVIVLFLSLLFRLPRIRDESILLAFS